MSDNKVLQVKIEATYGQFQTAFTNAKEIMTKALTGMKTELKEMSDEAKIHSRRYESTIEQMANVTKDKFIGINGAIKGLKTAWAQLGVVVAAGWALKSSVDDAVNFNVNAEKLARTLGITTNASSGLAVALHNVHSTTDEYVAAAKGLDTVLKKHEEGMNSLGVVTRDASGHLRNQQDIMVDALAVVNDYKEGTDRNEAAIRLFGKGVDISSELLGLNADKIKEAQAETESYNEVVGSQSKEATDKYRDAMAHLDGMIEALKVTVGNALLPVLTDLAAWMVGNGASAVLVFRTSIATVVSVIDAIVAAFKMLWEAGEFVFKQLGTEAAGFAKIFDQAYIQHSLRGTAAAWKETLGAMTDNASEAWGKIGDSAADLGMKLNEQWVPIINGDQQGTAAPENTGDKHMAGPSDDGKEAAKEAERQRKEALAAAKAAASAQHKIDQDAYQARMELLRGDEEANKGHWDKIRADQQEELAAAIKMYGQDSREAEAARNKITQTERAAAAEHAKLEELKTQATRNAATARIDAEEQAAQFEVQLGAMTHADLLAKQLEFEDRRYQIKAEALQAQATLAANEPIRQQEIYNELESLEQDHQRTLLKIKQEGALEQQAPMQQMGAAMKQTWAGTIASLVTHQMTWAQAVKSLYSNMLSAFTQYLTTKLAASKLFATLEIAIQKMVATVLRALGIQSAASSVASKTAESDTKIVASASVAGAGAAESQASIPYVGPILAIAAMAAMVAAVMAMRKGGSHSAKGGFDIPAGFNPLTQLHQREMVLPAEQAEVIRNLANNGGSGSGSGDHVYHIHALDSSSLLDALRRNPSQLAAGIRHSARMGHIRIS